MQRKAHKTGGKRSPLFRAAMVGVFSVSVVVAAVVGVDQVMDGQADVLQGLGLEQAPHGPTDFTTSPEAAPTPREVAVSGTAAAAVTANDDGLPEDGMDAVDLTGISPGGGRAPEGHDWEAMRPSELAIPQANLVIPVVTRNLVTTDGATTEMDLPVSYQAGWLASSAAVGAEQGTTVIAGHVNWADGSWAPMSNLYNATPGMTVLVTGEDGSLTSWRVTQSDTVPQTELSDLFALTDTTGPRQLILITCEASLNNQGDLLFDKNHVVTAIPLQD